jgi:hypothetical protein
MGIQSGTRAKGWPFWRSQGIARAQLFGMIGGRRAVGIKSSKSPTFELNS